MMEAILERLIKSPKLAKYTETLIEILEKEKKKRLEFYAVMKENEKVEFINGDVVYQTPVKRQHSEASDLLENLIINYVILNDLGEVGHEKRLISLTRNDYEPDIAFWNKDKSQYFTEEQMHFPAPDFIVEVLSKSTEKVDRGIKMEDYAAHGVQEYWLVDTKLRSVEQYFLEGDTFSLYQKIRNGDLISSRVIKGFEIPVSSIFDSKENLKALQTLIDKNKV